MTAAMKYRHVLDQYAEHLPLEVIRLQKLKDLEFVIKYLESDAMQKHKIHFLFYYYNNN